MHVAHFIQRYPPALGGSEAYFARLGDYLVRCGDRVDVWTTTAVDLEAFWRRGKNLTPQPPSLRGKGGPDAGPTARRSSLAPPSFLGKGVGGLGSSASVRRYPPLRFPARRYILKALSLIPSRPWQCLTVPCNPLAPRMWRDAAQYAGPLDAVHATAFPYAFPIMCGLRLARRRGVPFFLTPFLHLGDPADAADPTRRHYTAPHLRWLLNQADRVFVQTRLERDAVIGSGVPAERVVLQGLGVDAVECTGGNRDAARAAWGVGPNEVVVGHLANNSVEKGTVDLLRAAGGRVHVVLAGPEMPNFRAFWDHFPHRDRVIRLGVLSDGQKRDFFAGIDAFALPSRSDSFGLVLLEAWANGKPNLVYRAGGPAELVRDGIDGLHAKCGDVAELAAKLELLASEAILRRRLGAAGRSRLDREFRWDDSLGRVRKEIEQVVYIKAHPSR